MNQKIKHSTKLRVTVSVHFTKEGNIWTPQILDYLRFLRFRSELLSCQFWMHSVFPQKSEKMFPFTVPFQYSKTTSILKIQPFPVLAKVHSNVTWTLYATLVCGPCYTPTHHLSSVYNIHQSKAWPHLTDIVCHDHKTFWPKGYCLNTWKWF